MGHNDEVFVSQVLEQDREGSLEVAMGGKGIGCLDAHIIG